MDDKDKFALVLRSPNAVEKAEQGARRVLSGMVADTLALAKKEELAAATSKFRIGEYEWREPDYRQILIWAKALALEPHEIIRRLLIGYEQEEIDDDAVEETTFAGGAMLKLYWDFHFLPLETFEWVEGLTLTTLNFVSTPEKTPNLRLRLPSLRHFGCWCRLDELDLSGVPGLTYLRCETNRLTKLDLSDVPMLTHLSFCWNQLTELDLSSVPMLRELRCSCNDLTKLELSDVPMLRELHCIRNKLAELDVSGVPLLTSLACTDNQLTKVDLAGVPMLTHFWCGRNELTELDLADVPKLEKLSCVHNQLTGFDLSQVRMLTELDCCANKLTELDVRSLFYLEQLTYDADSTRLIRRPDQNF